MTDAVEIPKISILMPVYNTEKYLSRSIESVLSQTFKDFEIIAVDDGSNDNSVKLLEEYSRKDSRVKVFQNEKNRGVSYSLNHAIRHASAPLVARMDSDDIMVRDRLEKQFAYMQQNPDCVVLGGQELYINEKDEITGSTRFPLTDKEIKSKFFFFQPIADPTSMYNRSKIPAGEFYFDENLTVAEGLDLYFRLFKYGKFANLKDGLVLYRQREGSLFSTDLKRTFRFISKVRRRAKKQYGIKPPAIAGIVAFMQKIITSVLPLKTAVKMYDAIKKIIVKTK
ncbi:MAG TPA: glycosyltransferase [Ruminiclostridium sp.]|nr:glycosyltransferase [Ruminiclostridium sp.]